MKWADPEYYITLDLLAGFYLGLIVAWIIRRPLWGILWNKFNAKLDEWSGI